MPHTYRNFVIAYIILVGLPLLGLAGILKSGRALTAPTSIDGNWKMEADAGRVPASPCDNFLASVSRNPISISQSGAGLVIAINGGAKSTAGVLEGKTIKASFAHSDAHSEGSPSVNCGDQALMLSATVDPKSDPRTMNGTFSVDGCSSCVPVEFRAVRQPRSSGGGRH